MMEVDHGTLDYKFEEYGSEDDVERTPQSETSRLLRHHVLNWSGAVLVRLAAGPARSSAGRLGTRGP